MRLTAKQLRRIIAEEAAKLTQAPTNFNSVKYPDELHKDLDPNREYGEPPSAPSSNDVENIRRAAELADPPPPQRLPRHSSWGSQNSSHRRRGKRIAEGHARITEEEVAAWKSGDWGFNSQQDSATSKLDDHDRFLHGSESGHPMDDEGYMVKSRMSSMKTMASDVCDLLDSEDQLPSWVQDLVASSHTDMQHVHDYLMGDEEMRSSMMAPHQQKMPLGEGRFTRHMKRLSEGHARITQEEMIAWKNGDWGFISETESDLMRNQPEDGSSMQISSQINRLRRRDK